MPQTGLGFLHKGEFVFTAAQMAALNSSQSRMMPAMAGASNSYGGDTYIVNLYGNNPEQVLNYLDRQLNRRGVKKVST